MSQETIKIEDLQRVELRENDTLIVRLPRRLPSREIEHISRILGAAFPNNKSVILAQGMEVFVIRPGEQPPDDPIDWSGFPDPTVGVVGCADEFSVVGCADEFGVVYVKGACGKKHPL